MDITKTAKKQFDTLKGKASVGLDHVTPNEKLAAVAAIGVVVGSVAGAVGHAMISSGAPDPKKPPAPKKPATS